MPANLNKALSSSEGASLVDVDRKREMALYDALPKRWRQLYDSLPILQAVGPLHEYRTKLGDSEAYKRVVRTFRLKFPGWSPPSE